MVGVLSAHFESVTVALTREFVECDSDRLSVAVGHLSAYFRVKPRFVHACGTRILAHVIVCRTVLETDTILDHGLCVAHALEEIPAVVAVVPCPAAYVVVAVARELLVGKAVSVTAEVGGGAVHRLIVEVVVAVHVFDDVIAAFLHLATGVG